MYRVYKKTIVGANPNVPTDYATDGTGALCEICVKQITLTDGVAAGNNAVIGIAPSNVNIQTFAVLSLNSSTGIAYAVADPTKNTTYVLSKNETSTILTIAVAGTGTAITANSVLQVLYTVGA